MKGRFILWSLIVMLWSCNNDEHPRMLTVSSNEINLNANGDAQTIDVVSDTDWVVTPEGDWFTVTPLNGSGNQTLTISANPNSTGEERIAYFWVSAKSAEIGENIAVTQIAKVSAIKLPSFMDDGGDEMIFTYNNKRQLTTFSYNAEQIENGYTITLYYENDELQYIITHENKLGQDLRIDYTLTGNTVTCTGQQRDKDDVRDVTYTITLNEQGLPVEIIGPWGTTNKYQYDQIGNPTNEEEWGYQGTMPQITNVMQYDTNKGVLYYCTTPKWWWYQQRSLYLYLFNNVIDEIYTKGYEYHWIHQYTYDGDSYPVAGTTNGDEEKSIEYTTV